MDIFFGGIVGVICVGLFVCVVDFCGDDIFGVEVVCSYCVGVQYVGCIICECSMYVGFVFVGICGVGFIVIIFIVRIGFWSIDWSKLWDLLDYFGC